MIKFIPAEHLTPVGKYFMYTPFSFESYVALLIRAVGENIFVMRYDDLPVDMVEKIYTGEEVSPSYGYSLNQEKLISFLDSKADFLGEVVNLMANRRRLLAAHETLNLMVDLKAIGFTQKVIIRVLNHISREQFIELRGVWKNKPHTLKEHFKKLVGGNA